MKHFRIAPIFASLAIFALCAAARGAGLDDFQREFANPPSDFGAAPFWSWNEILEPDEMKLQLDEFADKGMGGFFMHAREGLITKYMGPEWMDDLRLSVARSKELGLKAYLYDEDRWPSGFASGKVPAMNDDFRQKGLAVIESEAPLSETEIKKTGDLVAVFEVELDDLNVKSFRTTEADAKPAPGRSLLYFIMQTAQPTEWFNSQTYIDTLNPAAVDAFISVTHEVYKKAVGDEFSKTVPSIFTDEPEFVARRHFAHDVVPWTQALPATFEKERGYSIVDNLPLLFYQGDKTTAGVRLDFWTTATEMFRDAFFKRIFDWGEKNNIELTGHLMLEDTLQDQVWRIGAAMPSYEYMQRPGMDHLGRNIDNLLTAKQVSSVAHQFSRPLILTENYGCSGWNLSFENMKWMADWHYALGVNFINPHLSWYSMRGARKRDYPTTFQYPSPWWKDFRVVADYIKRATFATAQGDYVAETLVLHPITTAWTLFAPQHQSEVVDLNKSFTELTYALSGRQVDYDLGDELIIARHGSVKDGKFIVKDMAYRAVVIPDARVLRESTLKLLRQFADQGGEIISIGGADYISDGRNAETLEKAVVANGINDALNKLLPLLERHVDLQFACEKKDEKHCTNSVYLHQRDIGGSAFLLFVNTDQVNGWSARAELPYSGKVRAWDLFTGQAANYPNAIEGGKLIVPVDLTRAGSLLLSVTPDEQAAPMQKAVLKTLRAVDLQDDWAILSSGPNAVNIDTLNYKSQGDSVWVSNVPTHAAQDRMESPGAGGKFALQYKFNIAEDPQTLGPLYLVLEQPEGKDLSLNGMPLAYDPAQGWWIDKSFRKIDISQAAKKGKNVLEVNGEFKDPKLPNTRIYVPGGTEIESVYVIGDFSVASSKKSGFLIVPPNRKFSYGDMAERGYPFYSGTMSIEQTVELSAPADGEKAFLEIDGLEAITARVFVNGSDAGLIAFHPHELDVADFVKDGENTIRIDLTNSNRNLLGPHHAAEREPLNVGPGTFEGGLLQNRYNFIPFGVSGGVRVTYRE